MKKNIVVSPEKYLSFMKTFGLAISLQTGGQYFPHSDDVDFAVNPDLDLLEMTVDNQDPIVFMDGPLFLKTLRATETSLNMSLFI